jgi:hypothetical protein
MRLGVRPPASALSNPVIEALICDVAAGSGYPDEEGVRFDVVEHMKGAAARVLGTPDKGIGVRARNLRQHARPPRRQEKDGRTGDASRLSTNTPCNEQAGLDQETQTKLRAAGTLEEELLELLSVQVAVLIESHEDGDVSSGQSPKKRFIRNLVSSHRS